MDRYRSTLHIYTLRIYTQYSQIFLLEMTNKGIFFNDFGQAVGSTTEMCPKELRFVQKLGVKVSAVILIMFISSK